MRWDTKYPTVLRWDMQQPPVYWDRLTPPISPEKNDMQPFKVLINYSRLGNPRYLDKTRFIVLCLTTEPMLTLLPDPFPVGIPTRPALTTAFNNFEAAFDLSKDSKAAKKDRKKKRAILDQLLKDFVPHLETNARNANDITILEKSGFDLRKPIVIPTTNGIPAAPLIFVKRGQVSGSVIARVKPLLPHIKSYQGEYAVGDPTVEANFKPGVVSVTGSRVTFTGLEVAKLTHVRVRGIGSKGPGDWSDPVGIIVT